MTTRLTVDIGQYSVKGDKANNDDFYAALIPQDGTLETRGICCVVADGMGNTERAAESSEQCVKTFLSDYYSTPETWSVRKSGSRVLSAINRWLLAQSQNSLADGMVTTFSGVVFKSTTAHIFHVGDCRIYRMRDYVLERLTHDHRVKVSRGSSHLSRAMGLTASLDIDYQTVTLEPDDLFMLISDGVHDVLSNSQLKACLVSEYDNLDVVASNIVQQAVAAGSHDDVTAQLIAIRQIPARHEKEIFSRISQLPFPPYLGPGMSLDGYLIEQEIHSSHTSQIFRVRDQHSAELLMMKTPSLELKDNRAYVERFYREEWAGKHIQSPWVVKVIEPLRKRSFLYYLMEPLSGITLREWIRQNPQPEPAPVVELIQKVIAGIQVFHRLDMLHRDIRPENIMLDQQQALKIIDFGCVKIAGIEEITGAGDRGNTRKNTRYAAAELLLGGITDQRTDLYSTGVMLYEMLTGRLPYGCQLKQVLSWDTLGKIKYQSALRYNPRVPLWLDGAIEKAVKLDIDARYASFAEFLYDLNNPNPAFNSRLRPLVEKQSNTLWKLLALVLFLSNLLLLFFLLLFDVID